jgi:AMMECR1 domain-containing protein
MEMEKKRENALDRAFQINRLLDRKYYPDIAKAIETKDAKLFETTCMKADIPPKMIKELWKLSLLAKEEQIPLW